MLLSGSSQMERTTRMLTCNCVLKKRRRLGMRKLLLLCNLGLWRERKARLSVGIKDWQSSGGNFGSWTLILQFSFHTRLVSMAASTQALITLTWATWAVSNMVLASWLLHHFDTQQLMRGNISFWLCPNLQPTSVSFPISLESSPPSLLPLSGASYLPNTVAISEWLAAGDSAPSHRTRDILLAPNFLAAFAIWKIRWAYQKRRLYFRSQNGWDACW